MAFCSGTKITALLQHKMTPRYFVICTYFSAFLMVFRKIAKRFTLRFVFLPS
ncbi:hypothetical protein ECOK1357_0473 [Escherichia coli OK1357]|nr:hypothetical protein ECOK1357_0473 [Escherichia coli OK1357]